MSVAGAAERAPREPAAAALQGREIAAAQHQRRERHGADRADDHDHRDHVAHRIGDADRGDLEVGLRRQHVGHVEQERRRQVVEHLDEHQGRARHIARQRQREHDAREQREAVRPEILRRFLHGRIDIGERGREIEQDERKIMQRLDEDDAVEPLHERNTEAAAIEQHQVDGAVPPIEELHRHRADEGRHHQRHHAERVDERGTTEAETGEDGRERNRDQARQHDRHRRHVDRVPEGLAQQAGGQEVAEVHEARPAVGPGEGDDDHAQQWNDQEGQKEHRNGGERDDLSRARAVSGRERGGNRRAYRRQGSHRAR